MIGESLAGTGSDEDYVFEYDAAAIAHLHAAIIGDVLASSAIETKSRNQLLGQALRARRELMEAGEFEAAAQYDELVREIDA